MKGVEIKAKYLTSFGITVKSVSLFNSSKTVSVKTEAERSLALLQKILLKNGYPRLSSFAGLTFAALSRLYLLLTAGRPVVGCASAPGLEGETKTPGHRGGGAGLDTAPLSRHARTPCSWVCNQTLGCPPSGVWSSPTTSQASVPPSNQIQSFNLLSSHLPLSPWWGPRGFQMLVNCDLCLDTNPLWLTPVYAIQLSPVCNSARWKPPVVLQGLPKTFISSSSCYHRYYKMQVKDQNNTFILGIFKFLECRKFIAK